MALSEEKVRKLARFARLRPVATPSRATPSDAAVRRSLSSLGRALRRPGEAASIHVRVVTGGRELARTLVLSPGRADVVAASAERPNLEVILSRDDWWAIACGETSPAAIFLMGRMRLRGDCQLARRLYRRLATARGSTDVLA